MLNSNFRGRKFRSRENEIKMQKCLVYRDFKRYIKGPQLLEVAVLNSNFRGRKFRSRENEIKMQKMFGA